MIQVFKSPAAPSSLSSTSAYDGEDVKLKLLEDQHGKCYLCERFRDTDFEIEHYRSVSHYPGLSRSWGNLFMGCRYCNGKKSDNYDDILKPDTTPIEDQIEQRIDFQGKKAVFTSRIYDDPHEDTICLLNSIFNGSRHLRTLKEERFFEQVLSNVNRFLDLVKRYVETPNKKNEQAVRDELSIDKEQLGFKYWIIRDNPTLNAKFSNAMEWNRIK